MIYPENEVSNSQIKPENRLEGLDNFEEFYIQQIYKEVLKFTVKRECVIRDSSTMRIEKVRRC